MKKLLVLAVVSIIAATSAFAGEMKWSGSMGYRYENYTYDDGLGSQSKDAVPSDTSHQFKKQWRVRANIGVNGGWDNVEYGFGVRTGSSSSLPSSDWSTTQSNQNGGGVSAPVIDNAWFRYLMNMDTVKVAATIGHQPLTLAYDTSASLLFYSADRFDGFGWKFDMGMFGLNAGQYILGARNGVPGANPGNSSSITGSDRTQKLGNTVGPHQINTLFAFQPYMKMKFADDIETMFAVGYYVWNDDSNQNLMHGGYDSSTLNATATSTVGATAASNFRIHNPRQWHFYNTWSLPFNLAVNLELIKNKKSQYDVLSVPNYIGTANTAPVSVSSTAWTAGIAYGAVKKAHDFKLSYNYFKKGIASVINTYSYTTLPTDNKGHLLSATYRLAENFDLNAAWATMKEIEKIDPTTGVAYAGTNANEQQKTTYWQLQASMNF